MRIKQIGLVNYAVGLKTQESIYDSVLAGQDDTLILCQHNHVYTFGKSAERNNLLISESFLKSINAQVFETDRGGDITYHGPGQLVGYPIINLRKHGLGVKKYVELLEQSIIDTLAKFGIVAYQIPSLTGIWVGAKNEVKRKIGAIGIRVKNGVSMHGFALNVSTDLSYFNHIVPCGIADKEVTSIEKELGNSNIDAFATTFEKHFNLIYEESMRFVEERLER